MSPIEWILLTLTVLCLALVLWWAKYRRMPLSLTVAIVGRKPVSVGMLAYEDLLFNLARTVPCTQFEAKDYILRDFVSVVDQLERQRAWPILAKILGFTLDQYLEYALIKKIPEAVKDLLPQSELPSATLEKFLLQVPQDLKELIEVKLDSLRPSY